MRVNTRKMITAAMFTALVCVTTLIAIRIPFKGYINLGDSMVLLSGWTLSPLYGFWAAGIGSAMADIFLGYTVYAPVTFVIKGLMALAAYFIDKSLCKKIGSIQSQIVGGLTAEIIMIAGYYLFEGFMYGFISSTVNIPFSAVQGAAGFIVGIILAKIFEKIRIKVK